LDGPIAGERADLWKSRLSTLNSEHLFVLLAENLGEPIGFACILLDEYPQWGACLDNLHVLPGWKGRGVGRLLLNKAVQWVMAAETGWPIHLWVFEANASARRFYDALGGEIVEYHKKEVLKGIDVPSVLYVWRDLQELLNNLTRGSTRTGEQPAG
jgi:GNAT superfamily N-acetyltransferase